MGIQRITKKGIVCQRGTEFEVDLIIFATGFQIGWDALDCGYPIVGENGVELKEKWKEGPRTLNSIHSHGFPNLFMQNGPQGTLTVNFVQKIDEKARHAAHIISEMKKQKYTYINATKQAEDEYCDIIWRRSGRGASFKRKCTPGYYNREGKPGKKKTLNSDFNVPNKYFGMLDELRAEGKHFEGFVVS